MNKGNQYFLILAYSNSGILRKKAVIIYKIGI